VKYDITVNISYPQNKYTILSLITMYPITCIERLRSNADFSCHKEAQLQKMT